MAKGTSSRGSANGSPSSLTTLLAPAQKQQPTVVTSNQHPGLYQTEYVTIGDILDIGRDLRKWDPTRKSMHPGALIRRATRLYEHPAYQAFEKAKIQFNIPRYVGVCVRRKIRKQVLFATKRQGKNGGKKKHRNMWSSVKC